jgi:hypothetical protein
MRRNGLAVIASILLTWGSVGFAQRELRAADRSDKTDRKATVTYGRVKEITPAKVLVDVANAPDKSFDLTDRDKTFHVASGLKVGDPVMISERKINGKDVVDITEHSGGGVKHGAKTHDEEVKQAPKQ